MMSPSARLSFLFANLGHFYIHLFTAFYAVVILQLEKEWTVSYEDLLGLWTVGSLLVGLMALPAGRLGDIWSARVMMVVFFIGMGLASIICGLMDGPTALMLGLAALGVFAAIYHPVGIPWLIRNAERGTGKILALNGIFGSFGTAGAGVVAGGLTAWLGWRAAFILPGVVCLLTGLVMLYLVVAGRLEPAPPQKEAQTPQSRGDALRVFLVLVVAMFVGSIVYHTMQNGLPKVFAEQLRSAIGDGPMGAGVLMSIVFIAGGVMQIAGGFLADRFALKTVYLFCWSGQMIFLGLAAAVGGFGLVGVAALAVMANVAAQPAENIMLARYAPEKHHGLAFGCKFVLTFMAAPAAIQLIVLLREWTGGLGWLFGALAVAGLLVVGLILTLPVRGTDRTATKPA
jgi:MFS family permease